MSMAIAGYGQYVRYGRQPVLVEYWRAFRKWLAYRTPAGIRARVEAETARRMEALQRENQILRGRVASMEASQQEVIRAMQHCRDETKRAYRALGRERPFIVAEPTYRQSIFEQRTEQTRQPRHALREYVRAG